MPCQARAGGMLAAHSAVPHRLSPKRRQDGPKGSSAHSSRSPSSSSPCRSASPHQNGHKGSAQNGRHSHGAPLPEPSDVRRLFLDHRSLPSPPPSAGPPTPALLSPLSPLAQLPPRPAGAHTGGMWGAGCSPPSTHQPSTGCMVSPGEPAHHLGAGIGAANRSPPPQSHASLCRYHPLGTRARQARVTAGLSTSLVVD